MLIQKKLDTFYPIWKTKCILSIQLNGLSGKKKTVKMKTLFKYHCDLNRLYLFNPIWHDGCSESDRELGWTYTIIKKGVKNENAGEKI
jgi:hypothetical protein